ncbi:Ornithine decarboxylase [Solea senegalensis]|uniref:Ornithine decarboxylase n=1 Tax=Solea senegalensis TaxID=28829 RepID=A0AAV6S238_SOLSE|nr:ornithine decarboxylase-like [Solea senegalensis]KAG7511129.1 Ornithine decarboxylase [Solea senegalensis]
MNAATPTEVDFTFLEEGFSARDTVEQKINESFLTDDRDAFYVCDLGDVLKKHLRWVRALPRVTPYYAVKCNDTREVVMTLASLGTGFDCASKTEIQLVQSLGVDPSRIIYANPCKQVSHIKYASAHAVQMMTFDSKEELVKVVNCHDNAKLVLRITTDDSKSKFPLSMKFGAQLKSCRGLLERAKELGLDVIGVSFHVGCGCTDVKSYTQAISDAYCVFHMGEELGFKMDLLDIGGGFPGSDKKDILMFEEITAVINPALDKYFPADTGVKIIAEPGSFYVASAYTLVVNIIGKKDIVNEESVSDEEDGGTDERITDRALMYYVNDAVSKSFSCKEMTPVQFPPTLLKKPQPHEATYPCSIWGQTSSRHDSIVDHCFLPDLQVSDWLIFEDMGAYTISSFSNFSGFINPNIHYVISRPAWQHVKQVQSQAIPAPVEESHVFQETSNE